MGQKFSLKLFKNKMALSKTNRDGTRPIGGARAWWVVEQFRAASSVLFHFSNLAFLFVVHAQNRHDLRSHVLVGNTTLRRRPCIGSWHVQPAMQTTRAPALVLFADDWTDLVLRAHGEASAPWPACLRPPATWQEVSLIVVVDRRRQW